MGAAARGGEQPTLEHAWSSMLAIVTMRAGGPCWARRATISGLLIFWNGGFRFFFKRSDNCLKESGLFLGFSSLVWRVGRWQPVAFLEAGSQNLGEYPWELK